MDRLVVETSLGPLPFVGRIHTDRAKPAMLIIGGAFAPSDHMHDMVDMYPQASILVGYLPGMHSASLGTWDMAKLSSAFDEALALLFPSQPLVAYGVSTGALITLGLKAANLRRHLVEEPFLSTESLWPFIAYARDRMTKNPDLIALKGFFWEVFGITHETVVNRDYRSLLDAIAVPTDVVVADLPLLPARDLPTWPSFITEPDRELMRANPFVTMHAGPPQSGHYLLGAPGGPELLHKLRLSALQDVAGQLTHK